MHLQMCGKTSSKLELIEVFYKLVLWDFVRVYYNDLRVHTSLKNYSNADANSILHYKQSYKQLREIIYSSSPSFTHTRLVACYHHQSVQKC